MAIVRLQPDASPVQEVTTPSMIGSPVESIFTPLVPASRIVSLLKYVEGYPWTVDFYGQILNKDNSLESFDPTTPNLTQPYYKVSKLILQVSSPLSSSYDSSTGVTTITGSAVTPYKITPSVGDVFVAQVDSGEDAIFHVTSVSRKTFRKDTLYEVSYTLYAYTSTQPDFIGQLSARVNDTYYFNQDTDYFNRDVLIKPSTKEAIDRLKIFLRESQSYYFSTFPQKRTGSIVLPGLDYTLHDPFLLGFIMKIVDYSVLVDVPFYRHAVVAEEFKRKSIYDLLLARCLSGISSISKQFKFISSASVPNRARLGTAFHAGVDYLLYPVSQDTPTNDFFSTVTNSDNYSTLSPLVVETTNNNQIYTKNVLPELFLDDHYVVSPNFYAYVQDHETYEDLSYIELLMYKFINKEAIPKEDLAVAVEKYHTWSPLHQLYILPVMWLLVKASV